MLFLIAIYFAVKYHVLNEKVKMYRLAGTTNEKSITVENVSNVGHPLPPPAPLVKSFFDYN